MKVKMKKIKIEAQIEGDEIGFNIMKSKDISLIEILGVLNILNDEARKMLQDKLKAKRSSS